MIATAALFVPPTRAQATAHAAVLAGEITLDEPQVVRSSGAELRWSFAAGPVAVEIHRGTSANFTASAATRLTTIADTSVRSFQDTTAGAGRTYFYRVLNGALASADVAVTTPPQGNARLTLRATADTYLLGMIGPPTGCYGWQNSGASTNLSIGNSVSRTVMRPMLRFDLRDVPVGATVSNATLQLGYGATNAPVGPLNVHRVTTDWPEGTGNATCDGSGASWNEKVGGIRWQSDGGDFDATIEGTQPSKDRSKAAGYDMIAVTGLVRKWTNGTANHGLLIKREVDTEVPEPPLVADPRFSYLSDESTTRRPALIVDYLDGSVSRGPTSALTAPAAGSTVRGTVALQANSADDGRVDRVEFLVDGASIGSDNVAPFEMPWNTALTSNGNHAVTIRATDDVFNVTTSTATTLVVDNTGLPLVSLTSPAPGTAAGTVTLSADASDDKGVARVEFYSDNLLVGEDTVAPYSVAWNTLDPFSTTYDGAHILAAKAYDAGGQTTTSATVVVNVVNRTGQYIANFDLGQAGNADDAAATPLGVGQNNAATPVDPAVSTRAVATAPTDDSAKTDPDAFTVPIKITNAGSASWSATSLRPWYRWITPDGKVLYEGPAGGTLPGLAPGGSAQLTVTVQPPAVPLGAELAETVLRFDIYDSAAAGSNWFAQRGNKPAENPVKVAKDLDNALGFERFWQYEGDEVGAGMSTSTNVSNGNMLLRWTPFLAPGRGLSTMVDLSYNSLEDHSRSPAGNNFSLSISSLARWGERLDLKPPKNVTFVDGDGTSHEFVKVVGSDGVTRWQEPPGVNLYLREVPTNPTDRRWGITRPDNVTHWFDDEGYPRSVTDRNGNSLLFDLVDTPPGEDPGGPKKRAVKVTDAGGRSFGVDYYSKDEAKKAHVRGKIKRITDHSQSALDFDYYDDGNLLRLTQRGGTKATGEPLVDRSFVFTYTTSSGSGPAITDPATRRAPDPHTPNQSTRIFSVLDPRKGETTFDYYGPSEGAQLRWKLQSRTNRANAVTSFEYDPTNRVTTVKAPLSRTTAFTYDVDGKVVRLVNPLGQAASVEWSPDFKVTKLTEPSTKFSTFTYNANGYLTSSTNQDNERTELTYLDSAVDANDAAGKHLSLLATVTKPKGVATPTVPTDFQTRYTYDAAGNVDKVTDPTGAVTDYDYNLAGSAAPGTLAAVKDANGNPPTTFPSYDPSGQPTQTNDPTGGITRVGYDLDGFVRWIQDPNHQDASGVDERSYKSFFDYDSFHRLGRQSAPVSTTGDRGRLIWSSVDFDENDNAVRTVSPHYGTAADRGTSGSAAVSSYDPMDRVLVQGNPDRSVDPDGERWSYAYDAAGRITRQTMPKGTLSATVDDFTSAFAYDTLDRIVRETTYGASTAQARHTHLCYDVAGDLRSVTSPRAALPSVSCPGNGPLTGTAFTASYDYDAAHRQTVSRDPLGHANRTTYDDNGNVFSTEQDIVAGRNGRTETEYDQRDAPVLVRQRFDAATGRTVVTKTEYDANGNVKKRISPRGVEANNGHYVTEFSYDGLNRQVRQTQPFDGADGSERRYTHQAYDRNGNVVWTSLPVTADAAGSVGPTAKTTMSYFDTGWVATSKDPRNPTIHFGYTAQGWQLERVPEMRGSPGQLNEQRRSSWTYFEDGLQASRNDYKGQPSTYTYDANNNLTRALDADGLDDPSQKAVDVRADYTAFDEASKVRYRKEGETLWKANSYTYDANGNVTLRLENGEENDAGTQTKAPRRYEMTYDGADWLSGQLDRGVDDACKNDERIVNTFWSNGLEKQRDVYRAASGCVADPSTWPKKQTTTWDYFDSGKLRSLVTKNGSGAVTESHSPGYVDEAGRFANGNRTTDSFILKRAEGNGATACVGPTPCTAKYTYDARDKLVSHQKREGKVTTYKLDEPDKLIGDNTIRSGNVTTENKDDGTTLVRRYEADQNKEITVSGVTGKYWYDDFGNLDCLTLAAGSQADCNKTDGAGGANLIADHTYDYLDRLKATRQYSGGATATDTSTYSYDALDRVTKQVEDHSGTGKDRTTDFTHQGMSRDVTEEKQTGGTNPKTKQFSYDSYGHRISMSSKDNVSGAEEQFGYAYDPQGSVSQLIGDSGQVKASYGYDAYGGSDSPSSDPQSMTTGDTDSQAPVNPFRYGGKRMDSGTARSSATPVASGAAAYDMGTRRYGPDMGRFWQEDMFAGSLADLGLSLDPLTQNRYALAGGNPISYVEFDGHLPSLSDIGNAIEEGIENVQGFFGEGPEADQSPDWMKSAMQTWDDLETASATNVAGDSGDKEAAADRLAGSNFGKLTGITDARKCDQGDNGSCAWAAAAFLPVGKVGTGAKAAGSFLKNKASYAYFRGAAEFINVSTLPGKSVFWSGPGSKAAAQSFARSTGRTTLDMTPGGGWLNSMSGRMARNLTDAQATKVWGATSKRFAEQASGEVNTFTRGFYADSIWQKIELPALNKNPLVTNINIISRAMP
ncbi:Ig-like domain-containing protein [Asanoa sp. NPDC049518]|uniref:Ig-like domain-containing protein n=1 Tax=unclassified Asanoa TaxID=2685164 RepID=UPI00341BA680